MIGSDIGHYRVVRLLGKGGMGEVYLADDTKLQRQVALKLLDPAVAADPDRRERFAREARAAAALNHPNIVTIHSVEEAVGRVFLTLEYVDGRTLAEMIQPGGLPVDRLLAIAISLTDAVGAAHQRGITHRDLKPANVMIAADGRASRTRRNQYAKADLSAESAHRLNLRDQNISVSSNASSTSSAATWTRQDTTLGLRMI